METLKKNLSGSVLWLLVALDAQAAGTDYLLTIKDHRFEPAELVIQANQKVKIRVENQDPTAEEFESYELNREKIVPAHGKITIFIGPLKPGTYRYFGDFNPTTAQGVIVAKE